MVVARNVEFFLFLVDTGEVKCVPGRVLAKVETRAGLTMWFWEPSSPAA